MMHLKVEDILKIKNLVTSNRITSHNMQNVNTLTDRQISEMYDVIYKRTEEIDEILFKYYKAIFFEQ